MPLGINELRGIEQTREAPPTASKAIGNILCARDYVKQTDYFAYYDAARPRGSSGLTSSANSMTLSEVNRNHVGLC
jgi:hypothetical protein